MRFPTGFFHGTPALRAAAGLVMTALMLSCGSSERDALAAKTFECDSTGERFQVTYGELEEPDTHAKFMGEPGVPVDCRICGGKDAYEVYYCGECETWYRCRNQDKYSTAVVCPAGHAAGR